MKPHLLLIALTAVLALAACGNKTDAEKGHESGEAEAFERGPHGGKLFRDGDFALEVSIYETGVEPQFRLYAYLDDKPLAPAGVQASVTVKRLGATQNVRFRPEADYLIGDQVLYEPHSFDVEVAATYAGKPHRFAYRSLEGRVRLVQASLQSGGITIATAGPARIATHLTQPGEVKIRHDRQTRILPRLQGTVVAVHKALGDKVRRGDPLLTLESRDQAELVGRYLAARKRQEQAKAAFEGETKLWSQKITSEQDYQSARREAAEADVAVNEARESLASLGVKESELDSLNQKGSAGLSRFVLRAPFDGVILQKNVAQGATVQADDEVFVLANLSEMEAEVSIYPGELGKIKVGQKVTLRALDGDLAATGKIGFLSSTVGESSRAAIAHVEFPNADGRWRDGQFIEADIVVDETEVPVAVTTEAIQGFRDWQVVFAQYGDDFEARPLTLGRSDGKFVEVVEGIPAGQRYASGNSFVLKAEIGKSGATHDH
ncbi:MAG: efflux RND transporter periplasmic adaptor subunit [Pseudomonadota bacterium]